MNFSCNPDNRETHSLAMLTVQNKIFGQAEGVPAALTRSHGHGCSECSVVWAGEFWRVGTW